ncbi:MULTISPECIES: hypothetical protein [unclassified Pedobacter]|uniref:hypothetical protein n=1 Tax=unclassified Pedobacter TaxID=2628915 RepID=UPI001E2D2788|nr:MULTISPECIES: hypothetical protein [unclassified Pedobacter]
MKKFYFLLFFTFLISLSVSARAASPIFFKIKQSKIKENIDKEKIESADEENQESGNLKTTEFILTQFSCVVFLKITKSTFTKYNIYLPTIYSKVPKQPPKGSLFFE